MAVGVKLTGASGEYISTPDHADFTPSTSIDLRIHAVSSDWSNGVQTLMSQRGATATNFGFQFRLDGVGRLMLLSNTSGTTIETVTQLTFSPTDGQAYWFRVTKDWSTGSHSFYYAASSEDEPSSWTLIETKAGTISTPADSADVVRLGIGTTGTTEFFAGTIYGASIRVDGSLVAEWSAPHTGTRYRDSTGKLWTLNGSAYSTVITA